MSDAAFSDASLRTNSYVSWSAVIAGGLLAAAYSFLLLTFGSAVGLSLTSPFDYSDIDRSIAVIASALWLIWVQVSGFALGGYIAGRVRSRNPDATEHEVEVRDGLHGVLVWAAGLLLGVLLALATTGSIVGGIGQPATALPSANSQSAASVSGVTSEMLADDLLRPAPAASGTPSEATRAEFSRLIAPALAGKSVSSEDRDYLARRIASETGVSAAEAETRVNAALREARDTAETMKDAAVIIAFIMCASLLISAAAAWWAADLGGSHRDQRMDFSRHTRWRKQSGRVASTGVAAQANGRDDLTLIKGIGPSLKNRLYEMDITSFQQIADFTQRDIDRVSEELSFPGRIERENWVGQARALSEQGRA